MASQKVTGTFGTQRSTNGVPLRKSKTNNAAQAVSVNTTEASEISSGKSSIEKKSKQSPVSATQKAEKVRDECKERLAQYRKTCFKSMVLSDQLDMRDPQMIAEYAQEIY